MATRNSKIIADWNSSHSKLFGHHTVKLTHMLSETGLFSRSALAKLIEKCPRDHYGLNTMGSNAANKEWREGEIGSYTGEDVIASIEQGRMWLNLRQVMDIDKEYGDVLDAIFSEFEARVPGLETFKHKMGILVSSPNVQVYYHCDIPGQMLWQIEGRKRIYIYPNQEPFLPRESIETVILGETEEEIEYQPWYDDYAEVYDLEAGDMLHWPLNGPHRVVNKDSLNISITTEHWTNEIRNSYAVHYANGVMRRTLGYQPQSSAPYGAHVYPKAALALACKKVGWNKSKKFQPIVDFALDPTRDNCIIDISPKPLLSRTG